MAKKTASWAGRARKSAKRSGEKRHPAASGGKWLWPATRLALYARDGFCCVYCGSGAEEGNPLTADHVVPVELGGSNEPENLVTACLSCNCRKRAMTLREWYALLRDGGVDTTGIAARVRAALGRGIDRAEGRRLHAARRVA